MDVAAVIAASFVDAVLGHPERLWALLALPVLLWLARPPRPRKRTATPHLELWLRARARLRRRPIRMPWLRTLLLLLAFTAGTGAFAGLRIGERAGPRELAIVLDTSASMAAGDEAPWNAAHDAVRAALAKVPSPVAVRLALCGRDVRVVQGDRDDLLAALPDHPAGPGTLDLAAVAGELAGSADRVATWTITDGLGPTRLPDRGALTRVGQPGANVGITALEVRDGWPLPDIEVSVEVRSFQDEPAALRITAEGGIEPVDPIRVTLAPGSAKRFQLALRRREGGPLRLSQSEAHDALTVDDAVEVRLPGPPKPDIVVLEDGDAGPWLRAAAAALAAETGGRVLPAEASQRASFVLAEGGVLPGGAPPRSLTFGTRQGTAALAEDDVVADPVVVDWSRDDPVTRGLDLSELTIRLALRSKLLPDGEPLIVGEHGALGVLTKTSAGASVHTAFRLSDSNLALLAAFPQLVRRSFAASYGAMAKPRLAPTNLLSAAESDLRASWHGEPPPDRPLPAFGADGDSLAVPLLLLALAALVLRVYL